MYSRTSACTACVRACVCFMVLWCWQHLKNETNKRIALPIIVDFYASTPGARVPSSTVLISQCFPPFFFLILSLSFFFGVLSTSTCFCSQSADVYRGNSLSCSLCVWCCCYHELSFVRSRVLISPKWKESEKEK